MTYQVFVASIQSWLIDYANYMWLGFSFSLVTVAVITTFLWSLRQMPPSIETIRTPTENVRRFPWLAAVLSLLIVVRVWAIFCMNSNWFIQDDAFDACIMPFQMSHHEPIWGGGTNYLTYLAYLVVYKFFDFSVRAASAVNVAVFILSFILIADAVRRELGTVVALFLVAVCAVSYPLILHSAYATAITFGFLPLGGMLAVLTRPAGLMSGVLLSMALALSLFLYPGGTLVGLCLIAAHAALMHRWWNMRAWIGLGIGGALGGVVVYLVRYCLSSSDRMTQWGGGFLQFNKIGLATWVVLKDTFWKSNSWNTYNGNAPYFEPMWFGLLLCGLLFLAVALARRRMGKEERWIAIALLVFFGSAVLSATAGVYPGVRRIVSAIPFLYLACAIVFARLWALCPRPWPILALILVNWALMFARSGAFAASHWPLSKDYSFMAESRNMLLNSPTQTRKVVILSYPNDQFEGLHYRCSLGLTKEYIRKFDPPVVMSRGAINTGMASGNMSNPFILLSFDNLARDQLTTSFGRAPIATCLLTQNSPTDLARLAEVHFFLALGGGKVVDEEHNKPPGASQSATSLCATPLFTDWLHAAPPEHGIRGIVFLYKTAVTSLRSLFGRTPDLEIITNTPAIPETGGVLTMSDGQSLKASDNVRVVFTGTWQARGEKDTVFRVHADDGCRIYLDGSVILDYDGPHSFGAEAVSKPVRLAKGRHVIVIDYFEWGGNAGLGVQWQAAGGHFERLESGAVLP